MDSLTINTNNVQPTHQKNLDEKSKLKLQKAVKDFEAIMVGYLLKSMRASQMNEDGYGDNFGGDLLEGMFDTELAKHITNNKSLGIGEMLYLSMTGESLPKQQVIDRVIKNEIPRAKEIKPQESIVNKPPDTINNRIKVHEDTINKAAVKHNVDSTIIKAVIAAESAGKADAKSHKNAKGLMQMIDTTASEMGVKNVWNPSDNINGGTKYLAKMLKLFENDIELALAAYNSGPGAVEKHEGIPPYKETKDYVNKVMNFIKYYKEQETNNEQEN